MGLEIKNVARHWNKELSEADKLRNYALAKLDMSKLFVPNPEGHGTLIYGEFMKWIINNMRRGNYNSVCDVLLLFLKDYNVTSKQIRDDLNLAFRKQSYIIEQFKSFIEDESVKKKSILNKEMLLKENIVDDDEVEVGDDA